MAVNNHGTETLKLSAEQVTPGSDADYYHKVLNGFIFQKLGHKVVITDPTSTTRVYTFSNTTTTLHEITVTYATSSKLVITQVEKTA